MREIALDTETTGLSPDEGDRIVEIGCVELINHTPTGKSLQIYLQSAAPHVRRRTAHYQFNRCFFAR